MDKKIDLAFGGFVWQRCGEINSGVSKTTCLRCGATHEMQEDPRINSPSDLLADALAHELACGGGADAALFATLASDSSDDDI